MAAPLCRAVRRNNLLRFVRFYQSFCTWRCYCTNNGKSHNFDERLHKSLFWQQISTRKDQASRSILVRLSGKTSEESLLQYCNSHGKVQYYFTYSQQLQQGRYALVEFKTDDEVDLILNRAYASNRSNRVQSRFLSFSGSGQSSGGPTPQCQQLNKDCSLPELLEKLSAAESVSDQLEVLAAQQELRDSETRLRFLVCSLIEEAFHGILPSCSLHLFGSSVNGFGRRSCDMDMFLERNTAHGVIPVKKGKDQYTLSYSKPSAESERVAAQTTLFTLASYLEKQVPHCMSVARILQAKCPLVKFRHHATGLSCDLTADNSVALKSSELLHVYSQLDPRVRPLVFMIRHWARHHGITNRTPGYWITNFPLTLLVVFFLQTRPRPVVPSFDYLRSLAEESDRVCIDGTDCTIPGDLSKVTPSENTQTTAELLQEFFSFCTTFDFEFNSLSIRSGQPCPKPDHSAPLYMENPFQTELNMCKNVSQGLLQEIQKHSQYALQMMDVPGFHGPGSGSEAIHPWGIGALLAPIRAKRRGKRSVLMDGSIGKVLRGLSQNRAKTNSSADKDPKSNSSGKDSTLSLSRSVPHEQELSESTGEPTDTRTIHVETVTALDASLQSDRAKTSHDKGTTLYSNRTSWDQLPNSSIGNSERNVHNSIDKQQPSQSTNCDDTQSQLTRRTQVPKLQITVADVRSRIFDRRYRKAPKGFVH